MQNFAATMGIAVPAHRKKECMPMDLRHSLYQLTQPLLTHRSLPHQYPFLPTAQSGLKGYDCSALSAVNQNRGKSKN
jgi:hypothetical protein